MQLDIAHDSLVHRVSGDGGVGGEGWVGDEVDHAGTEFIVSLADVACSPPETQPVFSQNKQVTARLLMRQALANKAALAAIDEGRIDLAEDYFLRAGELDKMIEVSKGGIGISDVSPSDVSELNNNMEDSDGEDNNVPGKVDPFRSSCKRKRQESEDSSSLPEVPYTSMTRDLEEDEDGKPFQFLNVVRKRGRPKVKREERFKKKAKSSGIELKNYLPMKKMEEMSNPKQRKQRCDKGKKRGSYKVGTQPIISDKESDKSTFPLRAPRAPVSHKALVEEFGESLRPDYCYTCDLPLVYNSSVEDCDKVITCRKCFSFIHSICLKNCKYCKDY